MQGRRFGNSRFPRKFLEHSAISLDVCLRNSPAEKSRAQNRPPFAILRAGSGRILRSASGGRLCVTVFGLLSRFSRYHLLRPAVHKRIPSARPPVRGPAWWSPDLWVPWSAALSAQCGADPSGDLHTAPMPAGSTIISTGIAGGPTVTGNTDRELAAPLLVCAQRRRRIRSFRPGRARPRASETAPHGRGVNLIPTIRG